MGKSYICIGLCALMLASVAQQTNSLVPTLRLDDSGKISNLSLKPERDYKDKKYDSEVYNYNEKKLANDNKTSYNNNENEFINYNDKFADSYAIEADEDRASRPRYVIVEPYKSLIQTTTRYAVAQTSLINYMHVDTFMDLINDIGYMLSSPYILTKAIKSITIALITLSTMMIFIPPVLWQTISNTWKHGGRLFEIERFLPNGLNELGIIKVLELKTEELLARFELNKSACRQQSVCQVGEMLRCAFPSATKSWVNFISENFSRPSYRNNKYIGSFLKGFIDRNCAVNHEMDESQTCLSSYIKSYSICSKSTTNDRETVNEKPTQNLKPSM